MATKKLSCTKATKAGTKRKTVPAACKEFRGEERKVCSKEVKSVCKQRPKEYRKDCLKDPDLVF